MKIIYVAFSRLPTEKAHGVQIMKTCEALSYGGAEVELVVPTRETDITAEPFLYYQVKHLFSLRRLKTPDFVSWGRGGFLFSLLWFSEVVVWQKYFWKADVVYSRDALVLFQYLLLGRRLVYEAHTKPSWVSVYVARRAYRVVVISEGLRRAYEVQGVLPTNILLAPDAVDLDFSNTISKREARQHLNLPQEVPLLLYVGRITMGKGAETFARLSTYAPAWKVVLIGEGEDKVYLQKKYPDALFLPGTPYVELPVILPAADVLVLPNSARDIDTALFTSPLKLYAYLASGVPVVAARVPALEASVSDTVVHFFEPDDSQSLKASVEKVLEGIGVAERVENGKAFARRNTWRARGQLILTHIT